MVTDKIINFLHYILGMFFNIAVVVGLGIAVYFVTMWGFRQGSALASDFVYVGEDYEVVFVLHEETPAAEVAQRLEYLGVINNARLFNLELFLMGRVRSYAAGTYMLNRSMSNTEVHQIMRGSGAGEQAPHEVIRIPEGWTINDMASYFEYRGFFDAEDFIYAATYGPFFYDFLAARPDRPNGLEGYLFPDTYQIPINPSPGDIIERMLTRFDQIFNIELREQAQDMGLTIDEVVIIASLIERETRIAHERSMISRVIFNRLDIDMNLEFCSTVAYVLDVPRDRLLLVDLQIDSPYNTYRNPGLPIGPIANPGEAAIRAALNPSNHDYLFFVLYNFETGAHYFSRTYPEHRAADDRARARE